MNSIKQKPSITATSASEVDISCLLGGRRRRYLTDAHDANIPGRQEKAGRQVFRETPEDVAVLGRTPCIRHTVLWPAPAEETVRLGRS